MLNCRILTFKFLGGSSRIGRFYGRAYSLGLQNFKFLAGTVLKQQLGNGKNEGGRTYEWTAEKLVQISAKVMKRFVSTYAFIFSVILPLINQFLKVVWILTLITLFFFILGGTLILVPTLYALKVSSLLTYQLSYYYFVPIVNEW